LEKKIPNPIKRLYKPNVPSRTVDLNADANGTPGPSAECEVTEYDSETGMEQWNDSVFMQDFEDSVVTVPAALHEDSKPAIQSPVDMLPPFTSDGKNSG
jgi:hypothetical protein